MTDAKRPLFNLPPAAAPATREFVFTSADFERVRKLIYKHAGISLSPVKQDRFIPASPAACVPPASSPSATIWTGWKRTAIPRSGRSSSIP